MDHATLMTKIVDVARRAPSVHNTQPWRWRIVCDHLELWADRDRSLRVSDPLGRNLVISCGAAVHHATVAAVALGAEPEVELLPDGPDGDLLARIGLVPTRPTPAAQQLLELLMMRRTDRRRFTSWPVPEEKLQRLVEAGRPWGATVVPVVDTGLRAAVEALVEDARRRQLADPRIGDETEAWIDRSEVDGVPESVIPGFRGVVGERPTRFGPRAVQFDERILRGTDRVLVITTRDDNALSWLRTGETLTAVWLRATSTGLSIVPLSQVVEVARTRTALEQLLPPPARVPQILARVGWQEIGRSRLPRTPRRPLSEVLVRA